MNAGDIVNAYCKRNNLDVIAGSLGGQDPAPIMPFLIMDCAYQEFCREIKPIETRHSAKKVRNRWLADYRAFNLRLFSCLDAAQRDFVIDLMDKYAEFIGNDAMLMKVAVMDLVSGCKFEEQKVIGSLMLINIYSQVAQIVWGTVFRTNHGQDEQCPELLRMRRDSHALCNGIAILEEDVNPNIDEKLNKAVDVFVKRTTKWLKSMTGDDE